MQHNWYRCRHGAWHCAVLVAAWVFCGYFALQRAEHAWNEFRDPQRVDGNSGHVQIDFAGQWVMARLFVTDGSRLYHRDRQWVLVREAFPVTAENSAAKEHDADALMSWFMGLDRPDGSGIGGPLYPPVHGLLYTPLGYLQPQSAYRLFQLLSIGLTAFVGLAINRATCGRVWVPFAILGVLAFPGNRGGLDLAQNHILTLAILAGGTWAMSRGRWRLGGAVWGLLAIKPTWAVAILPVLVLMGQWQATVAMCGVAGALILLTIPVVGIQGWLDWLAVGREASATYAVNENWISFSRDLGGIPRRLLVDFSRPVDERTNPWAARLGWLLWATVAASTAVIYRRAQDRRVFGLAAGFLLLGAYLSCYRFMYYDATLAALPVGLLVADRRVRRAWLPLILVAALYAYENWLLHFGAVFKLGLDWKPTFTWHAVSGRFNDDPTGSHLLMLAGSYRYAWDTALLLGLWAWAGCRLMLDTTKGVQGSPDVGRTHQGLANQHG